MAKIPISNQEQGIIYAIDVFSVYFYPLESTYYKNVLAKNKNFAICSFEEFKELYPFQIYNNYFAKTKSSAKIRLNKHNT